MKQLIAFLIIGAVTLASQTVLADIPAPPYPVKTQAESPVEIPAEAETPTEAETLTEAQAERDEHASNRTVLLGGSLAFAIAIAGMLAFKLSGNQRDGQAD